MIQSPGQEVPPTSSPPPGATPLPHARPRLCRRRCVSPLNSKLLPNQFPANQLTPLHAATLLRPERDAIVLPAHREVMDFWAFVKALLGLQEEQVGGGGVTLLR